MDSTLSLYMKAKTKQKLPKLIAKDVSIKFVPHIVIISLRVVELYYMFIVRLKIEFYICTLSREIMYCIIYT